jgi:hypothetical protein
MASLFSKPVPQCNLSIYATLGALDENREKARYSFQRQFNLPVRGKYVSIAHESSPGFLETRFTFSAAGRCAS